MVKYSAGVRFEVRVRPILRLAVDRCTGSRILV